MPTPLRHVGRVCEVKPIDPSREEFGPHLRVLRTQLLHGLVSEELYLECTMLVVNDRNTITNQFAKLYTYSVRPTIT